MRAWVIILVIIASILVLAVSEGMQANAPRDPFLVYADLLTKTELHAFLERQKFTCTSVLLEASEKCSLQPENSIFSEIVVLLGSSEVNSVSFHLKPHSLLLGDLVLLWDKPNHLYPHLEPAIMWTELDGFIVTALVPSADRLNYLVPVRVVSFSF